MRVCVWGGGGTFSGGCGSSVLHVMSVYIWSSTIWSAEYQLPIMPHVLLFCNLKWKLGKK